MAGEYTKANTAQLMKKYPKVTNLIPSQRVSDWYYSEMAAPTGVNKVGYNYRQKMRPSVPYFTEGTDTPNKAEGK